MLYFPGYPQIVHKRGVRARLMRLFPCSAAKKPSSSNQSKWLFQGSLCLCLWWFFCCCPRCFSFLWLLLVWGHTLNLGLSHTWCSSWSSATTFIFLEIWFSLFHIEHFVFSVEEVKRILVECVIWCDIYIQIRVFSPFFPQTLFAVKMLLIFYINFVTTERIYLHVAQYFHHTHTHKQDVWFRTRNINMDLIITQLYCTSTTSGLIWWWEWDQTAIVFPYNISVNITCEYKALAP